MSRETEKYEYEITNIDRVPENDEMDRISAEIVIYKLCGGGSNLLSKQKIETRHLAKNIQKGIPMSDEDFKKSIERHAFEVSCEFGWPVEHQQPQIKDKDGKVSKFLTEENTMRMADMIRPSAMRVDNIKRTKKAIKERDDREANIKYHLNKLIELLK